jgi:hypothetical protein
MLAEDLLEEIRAADLPPVEEAIIRLAAIRVGTLD